MQLLLLILIHIEEAFKANLIALKYNPGAVEMMDHTILESAQKEILNNKKIDFLLKEIPGAILIIEFARNSKEEIDKSCKN